MKLYLAAPLFSEAERAFNLAVAQALSAAGHEVYLPQRDTPKVDGAARTTAVFRANLAAVATADAVVAVCEGPQVDDGTAWEIGYAYGRKYPSLWSAHRCPPRPAAGLAVDPAADPHAALRGGRATGKFLDR